MYKIWKDQGYDANVIVENTDTKVQIVINRKHIDTIMDILEKAGYDKPPENIYFNEWEIEVEQDVAKDISKLAIPIKKPIRDQRKIKIPGADKLANKEIDAMDVLLGLASYN